MLRRTNAAAPSAIADGCGVCMWRNAAAISALTRTPSSSETWAAYNTCNAFSMHRATHKLRRAANAAMMQRTERRTTSAVTTCSHDRGL